jgi:SAM-dependent methyltransferase
LELAEIRDGIRQLRGEFTKQLSFSSHDVTATLQADIEALARTTGRETTLEDGFIKLGDRLIATDRTVSEVSLRLGVLESTILSRLKEIETALPTGKNASEASIQLRILENAVLSRLNEIDTARFEESNRLIHLSFETHSRLQELSNSGAEAKNLLIHLDAQTQARLQLLANTGSELKNALAHVDTGLNSRVNEILNVRFPGVLEQIHAVTSFQTEANASNLQGRRTWSPSGPRPAPTSNASFDTILARAQADFPSVFQMWRERLDEMADALSISVHGNVANAADIYSRLFRTFAERHIRGQVLDIGCGPFGRPFYLSGYPSALISGIEPLPFPPNDEVQIIRGISEYLPFADGSFETVLSATSLDHCLSLDKSLDEIERVLRDDGLVLLWIGSNPGSPPYEPLAPKFTPADKFHLFHFDHEWFDPLLARRFDIIDRVKLDHTSHSHIFYALQKKQG